MLTTALAFSGGKDSWACLLLNQHRLHEIVVLWVNTGKNYPIMLETIEKAREMCPNFVELVIDREGQIEHNGLPSDVVPVNWTRQGQELHGKKPYMIQSYLQCCYENIGYYLHKYCMDNGIQFLIKGQRNDEAHKSTSRNGDIINGIEIVQPIEDWSANEVLNYCAEHMELPGHFEFGHSSMDCYDCTAYSKETKDIHSYAEKTYPILFAEYKEKKLKIDAAIIEELE
jgi:3'-phosphoadenosine 5'-phosphosulfate sulfotransferase (PAPS reductase)/FAD synthetase